MTVQIDDNIKRQVSELLKHMDKPVMAKLFVSEERCLTCQETKEILEIIGSLAPEGKLNIELYEKEKDNEIIEQYEIVNYPAIFLEGEAVKGKLVYTGIPSGYEFGSIIEDILDVSSGKVTLKKENVEKLSKIDKPLTIGVFVTPTCPYCPQAVRLAHKAAMVNPFIKGEMVEATEFPALAQKYYVMGVPKTVINDGEVQFEGAMPEDMFIAKVMEAYNKM